MDYKQTAFWKPRKYWNFLSQRKVKIIASLQRPALRTLSWFKLSIKSPLILFSRKCHFPKDNFCPLFFFWKNFLLFSKVSFQYNLTCVAHCQIIFLKWNSNENILHNIKFRKNKCILEKTSANRLRFFYRFDVWFYVWLCAYLYMCLHLCLSLSEYLWMRERDKYMIFQFNTEFCRRICLSVFFCWYLCLFISVEVFQGERDTFSSSNSIQNRLWEMIPPVHQHC